jgi:branched-chain amino acid transport system ATP-binding protein
MARLEVRGLTAGYRQGTVVNGVDLDVADGQVVALLGRNGAGKTTLVSAIMGLVRPWSGRVILDRQDLAGRRTHAIARAGIVLVPQGRRLFGTLTVEEHLRMAMRCGRTGDWTLDTVYEVFPLLEPRRHHLVTRLSGGEQQMVSIARGLLTNPALLLMDEPSEGLAPGIVEQMADTIKTIADGGCSMVLVEQKLGLALAVADDVAVLEKGRIVHSAAVDDFKRDRQTARRLLGIG